MPNSTDYTHFTELSVDTLLARGTAGKETNVLFSSGTLQVVNAVVSATLTVKTITGSPTVSIKNLVTTGSATIGGILKARSSASISSTLQVGGNFSALGSAHTMSGTLSIGGNVTAKANATISGTLAVKGQSTLNGTIIGSAAKTITKVNTLSSTGTLSISAPVSLGTNKLTVNSVVIGSAANTITKLNSISSTGTLTISAPITTSANKATHNSVIIGSAANTITHVNTLSSTGTLTISAPITTSTNKATHNSVVIGSAANTITHVNSITTTGTLQISTAVVGSPIRTISSSVALTVNDCNVVFTGTVATSITLPAANALKGQVLSFTKTKNNFKTLTINRAGSDTIQENGSGATSTRIDTIGECLELVSDGTSVWYVINRKTSCSPQTYSLTIGGSSSAPTKPSATHVLIDAASWWRQGNGLWLRYEYRHNATTGAASGTGTYLFPLPNTSDLAIDTGNGGTTADTSSNSLGSGMFTYGTSNYLTKVSYFNTTNLYFLFSDVTSASNAPSTFASTTAGLAGNATVEWSFLCWVPISGWKA